MNYYLHNNIYSTSPKHVKLASLTSSLQKSGKSKIAERPLLQYKNSDHLWIVKQSDMYISSHDLTN